MSPNDLKSWALSASVMYPLCPLGLKKYSVVGSVYYQQLKSKQPKYVCPRNSVTLKITYIERKKNFISFLNNHTDRCVPL